MNFVMKMVEQIMELFRKTKQRKRVVSVIAALVLIVSTIAPAASAFAVEENTASTQAYSEEIAEEVEPEENDETVDNETGDDLLSVDTEESEADIENEEAGQEESADAGETSDDTADMDDQAIEEAADETSEDAAYSTTASASEAAAGETAQETAPVIEPARLVFEAENYTVYADFDESAGLPEGVELKVKEITREDDPEIYDQYYQKALEQVQDKYDENTGLSFAKFYDISFVHDGREIEPSGEVKVRIEYKKTVETETTKAVEAIHFNKEDEEKAEVIDAEAEGTEKAVEAVEFESDQFSVYGIVGTETITTQFTTGDGSTYEVVVSFDKEAGIPENAKLEVSEVTEADTDYYEYVSRTADAVDSNITDLNYIKLLDIKIIDENGNKVALNAPVDVQIRLLDTEETNYVQVVHFAESTKVEVIDPSVDVNTVCFETSGFSIYAIVDLEEEDHVARVQYTFQNSDGSRFEFLDASGNKVDYQIIKNGEALEQVDIPAIDASNQTFRGWFIYLKDGENYVATGEEIDFGEAISISTGADETTITATTVKIANADNTSDDTGKYPDYTVYLRPVYGNVHYLTFYNSIDGAPVYSRIQVDDGSTYDISQMEAVPPDATVEYDEDGNPVVTSLSYVFTGWSSTAGSTLETSDDPDSRTEISNTNVTVNSDMEFYPVFRLSHWLNFYSAPIGSGATYFPSVYILNGQTTASAKPTADPEWQGHEFVGWFLTEDTDYLSDGETADDAYQFNGTISSDTTLYAHWNAGTANVTVVYWRENVTDDKSVWKDETGETKSYEYYSQANYTATVGKEFAFSEEIILDLGRGYTTNTIKSDASVRVQPDGSSVLNVYIDRDLVRYLFYYGGTVGTSPGFDNEVYANKEDLEGTMLVMTGLQGQAISRYGYTFPNVGDYEGYVWMAIRTDGTTLMDISTSFGAETEYDPYEYTSTIHEKRFYVHSKYANSHFERYYQNTDGETYETEPQSSYWYTDCAGMNFSVPSNTAKFVVDHVRLFLDDVNGNRTYFKPVENTDGKGIPESTESEEEQWTKVTLPARIPSRAWEYVRDDEGNICQDLNAVKAAAADELALYPNNVKFYQNSTGVYKIVYYGMEIYYRRNQFTVKFIDTYDGTLVDELGSKQVYYEESLSTVKPGEDITLEPPTQEYKWDGKYYADVECTVEFDWTQTMPGKDVPVYIKWDPIYYWVKVDPDGGILSDTESTWFWETKGSIIEEYTDVVRPYVENSDGAYYYHYDEFNEKDPDGTQPSTRKAYYTTDEGEATDTETKYAVDGTAYSFVGWYEVDKETGQLIGLYNFDAGITGNTYLKAVWRSVGVYTVKYSQDGVTAEGDPLLDDDKSRISTNGTAPKDENQYIDKSYTSVAGSISAPEGYVFTGWYYNGAMYNAGDVLLIQSEMANDNREIWLYPVFVPIEDIPVEVTQITFHGNGYNSRTEMKTNGNVTVYKDNSEDPTIVIYPEIINKTVSLEGSNQYFSRPGFVFKGWALSAEATTPWLIYDDSTNKYSLSTGSGAQVKAVAADNIGATEEDGIIVYANDLYAIWEIKIVIRKVDISNTDKNLQDAVFNLYKVDDEGEDELLFEDIKSGADGLLYYNNSSELQLPLGTYHLVETSAPAGYNIKTSPVNITVSKSGITYDESTTLSSSGNGITYDEETGVYILLVTNSAGEELPHTGGTGTLMTAKADKNSADIKFTNTYNPPEKHHKRGSSTGDSANGALWALMLLLAGGALAGTVWFRRRKKI